jgi:hypothetical protein
MPDSTTSVPWAGRLDETPLSSRQSASNLPGFFLPRGSNMAAMATWSSWYWSRPWRWLTTSCGIWDLPDLKPRCCGTTKSEKFEVRANVADSHEAPETLGFHDTGEVTLMERNWSTNLEPRSTFTNTNQYHHMAEVEKKSWETDTDRVKRKFKRLKQNEPRNKTNTILQDGRTCQATVLNSNWAEFLRGIKRCAACLRVRRFGALKWRLDYPSIARHGDKSVKPDRAHCARSNEYSRRN